MNDLNSTSKDELAKNKSVYTPKNIPTNIPPTRVTLVGRDKEIESLHGLLRREDISLITLTGLGGTGKTSLALQVASSVLSLFPDGVYFIGLASLTKSETILIEIARILKVEQDAKKNTIEELKDFLSGRKILLVLDNFEHLMDATSQVNNLLQSSPYLKIIVTSRESLHLRVEQVFPVQTLSSEYAMELFTKRAQSLNPDFLLSQENTRSVAELCLRLDGLPLAIELAALRTKLFTPQAMLERLKPDLKPATPILDLLSLGARDLPKRQQSLRNTIAWSYGLLEAEEQSVFRAASIFPAGFSIQMLSALLKQNENAVLEIVSSLVDKNLVKSSLEKHNEPRFILLDSIREFAWDEILRLGELEGLKDVYVEIYLTLSEQADKAMRGDQQSEWFNRLDDEIMNISLVLEICLTSRQGSDRWARGYSILHNLHRYWMLRDHFHLAFQYIIRARASIDEYEDVKLAGKRDILALKAKIYSLSGSVAWITGNYTQASGWHAIAYLEYKSLDDTYGMAEALNNWAVNLGESGEYEASIEKHRQGLILIRKIGDRSGEIAELNNVGFTLEQLGRMEEALLTFEQALEIARELNDQYFIGTLIHNMAHLKLRIGDYAGAISLSQSSLEIAKKIETPYLHIWSFIIPGMAHLLLGNIEQAQEEALEGIRLADNISDIPLQIELLRLLVCIFTVSAKVSPAVVIFGVMEKIRSETDYRESPFNVLYAQELMEKVRLFSSMDEYEADNAYGMTMTFEAALDLASKVLEESIDVVPALSEIPELPFLTVREREVLILLARGWTNEQISKELVVVKKTVEKHVANVLMKLGVKNRTEAATWAIEHQLIQ